MKSALLTKAALCICPPAVVAGTVASVPPVRHAVHRFTAPHAPQRRPAPPPCVPVQHKTFASRLPSVPGQPVDLDEPPAGFTAFAPPGSDAGVPVGPTPLNPITPPIGPGLLPPDVAPPNGGTDNPPPPPVPEPAAWMTMVVGFGLIGAGYRQRRRYLVRSRRLAMAGGDSVSLGAGRGLGVGAMLGGVAAFGSTLLQAGADPVRAGTKLAQIGSKALHSSLLAKAALCVCPPVAMAVSTAAVPPVRNAVYKATAPSTPTPRAIPAVNSGVPCVPVDVPTAAQAVSQASGVLAVLTPTVAWPAS